MNVGRIRVALSYLIEAKKVPLMSALIIDVFGVLPDPTSPRILPGAREYLDTESIDMQMQPRFKHAEVRIGGYRIWRYGNLIHFEKTDRLEWEQRVVFHIEYSFQDSKLTNFYREVVREVGSFPGGKFRGIGKKLGNLLKLN